jgi:ParB-like chromosome segregation protein Spo0J
MKKIETMIAKLCQAIESLGTDDRVEMINAAKLALHQVSPFKSEPVDCVLWVKNETVTANDYNPNSVAPPEMKLLEVSIAEDGYTQPIVTFAKDDQREVVDGFHRNRVGKECEPIRARVHGYLPVVTINGDRDDKGDRMAATIRHNRARGKHKIEAMSEIVVDLIRRNWSKEKIAKNLGMDADEVLRLCQISGLAEAFADREFSQAWEAEE